MLESDRLQIQEPHGEERTKKPLPLALLLLVIAFSILLSGWAVNEGFVSLQHFEPERKRDSELRLLRGEIMRLDEVLTNSARLYAATGEKRWKERYLNAEPELRTVLTRTLRLVPKGYSQQLVQKIDTANDLITDLEKKSFTLTESHKAQDALALLTGPDYNDQKQIYANGMSDLLNVIDREISSYSEDESARSTRIAVASAAMTAILILWVLIFFRAGAWHQSIVQRIEGQRDKNRDVLESIQDVFMCVDPNGVVVFANTAASDYFGITVRNLLSTPVGFLFPQPEQGEVLDRLTRAMASKESESWTLAGRTPGQWMLFIANPAPIGATLMLQDITARKRLDDLRAANEAMLEEAVQNAEDAATLIKEARDDALKLAKARAEFLGNMSHEIRTPMSGVLGMINLLEATTLDEEQLDYVATVRNCADALLQILNDILDVSKLEAGKVQIESREFSLSGLLGELVLLMQVAANQNRVELSLKIDEGLEGAFLGDPLRIRQIVLNLVGNAVKFTSDGSVVVEVQRVPTAGSNVIRIAVRDTGPGIAADRLSAIFESFAQEDGSTTRRFGGTGLGLTICKQLVELMGGVIGVESVQGEGSTFYIQLALVAVPAQGALISSEVGDPPLAMEPPSVEDSTAVFQLAFSHPGTLSGLILIVEDNPVNQKVASRMLTQLGYAVEVAENGLVGVERAIDSQPDLVFMDIQMPEMDGWEATKEIRRLEEVLGRRVPIIAMTANVFTEDRTKCIQVGMDDFLAKPIKREELAQILDKYCPIVKEKPKAA